MSAEQQKSAALVAITMPKWGLSMDEGQLVLWCKAPGERFVEGEDLAEIETTKINNVFEAPTSGLLRRQVAAEGETIPVGGLIGVAAESDVSDEEIDAFIAEFNANFVPGETEEAETETLEHRQVDIGGRAINVAMAGAGATTVVLIHGFSGDANSWAMNVGDLAADARVLAIDLPGHGASSKNVGDGSVDAFAEAVSQTLDALSADKVVVVGHSLGAAVAVRLAQRDGARVEGLILVAPAGLPGSDTNRAFLDGIVNGQRARDLKPFIEMLFHNPALASQEAVEAMVRYKRIDGVEEALGLVRDQLAGGLDVLAGTDSSTLPPTLVVLGGDDRIVGAPDLERLPAAWKVVNMAGAGHMPHVEDAAAFNQMAARFVSENS